ncbi:MAG: DUF357 domain-containing protein [Ignisphaera sp.]|uniref:DUF357 domain-containing protein n=1 Tax=Ignisphaera aggregans TaxID=334771 RepID=A0A7C4JIY1_9CREN
MEFDPCTRLARYIMNFRESIKNLKILDSSVSKVISLAMNYLDDSNYYLEKGDCTTGLITISYAEGLLDALKSINAIEISWEKKTETIVFAAGSFDIIHPGHIEFLRWAASLGDKLVVVVSRDKNYRYFKGYDPVFSENERLKIVESIKYVYRAILGSDKDLFEVVKSVKPSVIALGYDQPSQDLILNELKARGLEHVRIVRMPERVGGYSSSSIKSRICKEWCKNL